MSKTKFCPKCSLTKPKNDFYMAPKRRDGLRSICKECGKIGTSNYYFRNRIKIKKRLINYYKNNIDIIKQRVESYRKRTKLKWRVWNRKYSKNRKKSDINFRLRCLLSSRISNALKGRCKSKTTINLIGCSIDFLKGYIENKFRLNMSWNNYGQWHIDHIKPCALFDLADPEQQKLCFHYTNLQPLWATTSIARKYNDFNTIGNKNKKDLYVNYTS